MQLEHSFSVPVGIDDAWKILLDIDRVGPCMPGALIESVDGDDFTGTVKLKLGPINLTYKGKASFIEKDESSHRAVIDARGRDARGNGTAAAKVTATLVAAGTSTTVTVNTDLDITGKPAQFGRGVMVDVGNKLIGQFADALAATLGAAPSGSADPGQAASAAAAAPTAAGDSAPLAAKAPARKAPRPRPRATPAADAAHPAGLADAPAKGPAADEPIVETPLAGPPLAEGQAADSQAAEVPAAEAEPAAAQGLDAEAPAADADAEADAEAGAGEAFAAAGAFPEGNSPTVSSVNGHSGRHGAQPQREVEPINLLESAGPAVAKRLAPVALALVIVLGAVRRRRGKRA